MRGRALVGLLAASLCVALAAGGSPAVAEDPPGSVTGTVTDAAGQPLEGVCVETYGSDYRVTPTAADGRYRVDDLPEGGYFVAFNACEQPVPGHAAEMYDNAAGFSDAAIVQVTAGQTRDGVDAALEEAATIRGTLTDEDSGDGLEGACAVAFELEHGMFAVTRAGADGAYALANLRGGEYAVGFSDCSDPFNHMSEVYEEQALPLPVDVPLGQEPTTVTVEPGEETDGVDAALTEGGSVVGTVTARHTGRPADFLCVAAVPSGSDEQAPAAVGITGFRPDGMSAPGQYVLPGVPPGDYAVGFNPEQVCGDDGYAPQWATDKATREQADVVEIAKGEAVEGVDAVIAPRPSISAVCWAGDSSSESRFSDVSDDSVHRAGIECLAENGIVHGRADGSYGPAEPVRRDQMATFVVGALRKLDVDLPADAPDAFRDDDASVHQPAINQLAALGVVGGKADGRYAPTDTVSRGQMATFLVRAYEKATGFALLAPDDAFTDDDGTSHEPSIDRATTAGLAAGTGGRAFSPGADVRRDQMATFVARLLDRVVRDTLQSAIFFSIGTGHTETALEPPPAGPVSSPLHRTLAEVAARRR